ncbi:universal stress protein [Metasolibacillus meyeri]|uniref:Universal stress protein n=1 Tax=Metasolibacillus meyeri TaxID=1071052 RepID=A0AAW9NQG7_9BACL|nr:universal stress protein [Metasolibacillus meyeri]MEC1179805.1 universal stress protein [Metasolibacillus meyeri]
MYQHIVLAADGSENAIRAAKEAVKMAKLSSNTVVDIVYVASFDNARADRLHSASPDSLLLERRRKVASVEQLLKEHNISYKVTILKGEPAPEIIQYVNTNHVDLVIIGSRGLNGLQEMVLGSVSHKVMKRVNCPALIVK